MTDMGDSHANLLRGMLPDIWPTPDEVGEVQTCRNAAWADIILGDHKVRIMVTDAPPETPIWQTDLFTDSDRQYLWESMKDVVRDDVGDAAENMCNEMGMEEAIGHLVNLELLLPYHKLQNPPDGMTTEELLTEIAEEPQSDHEDLLRFKLLEQDETVIGGYRITDLGIDVLQEFY